MARIGILGGTFNPVHVGHLRLALETAELLELDRVELMPCHTPAHKDGRDLLPFALRVELLHAAVAGSPRLGVTTLEADLPTPSYTWNSLHLWRERHPDDRGMFILGAEDFANLGTWRRGTELPLLMDFAVMARAASGRESFVATLHRMWPALPPPDDQDQVRMDSGTCCRFIVMPQLDISASLLRSKWLAGTDIRHLVPDPVLHLLTVHQHAVSACWETLRTCP